MNLDLVSIVIPAYNLPDYTEKAINSIISQTYRPIEIILSDDNSPISLIHIANKFSELNNQGIFLKYFRQKHNLGYFWNLDFTIQKATGKYLLMLDHDDWLTDFNFLSDSVNFLENNLNCYLTISNTLNEDSPFPFFNLYYSNFRTFNGMNFIVNYLFDNIHPSRSAIIFRLDKLNELNYRNYFLINTKMKYMPDEGFVAIILLASIGQIAVSGKIVSIRGVPETISVSRNSEWSKNGGVKLFNQYILLYYYFKKINSKQGMQLMLRLILKVYPIKKFNFSVIKQLNFDKIPLILMITSVLKQNLLYILLLPRKIIFKYSLSLYRIFLNLILK